MSRYIWRDTETSGANVRFDQIYQWAAIVTDEALNPIEEIDLRSRRFPSCLPSPVALAVTNQDPYLLREAPLEYFEFQRAIYKREKALSPAVFIGQNTLSFDEEAERTMHFMNLRSPYITSQNGSQRADTLVMLRFGHAIRPGVLTIGNDPITGNPIFKLEVIAPANGFKGHRAHEALGDVFANIFVGKIVKEEAPDIWATMMRNADPAAVKDLLGNQTVLLMKHFGRAEFLPATRIAMNPKNKNQALLLNLTRSLDSWLDMPAEEIAKKIFTKESPFETVKCNAQPTVFAPTDPVVRDQYEESVKGVDDIQEKLAEIRKHPTFIDNCRKALELSNAAFDRKPEDEVPQLESRIYDVGFPSRADEDRMEAFHRAESWSERMSVASGFQAPHLRRIALRLFWAYCPDLMDQGLRETMDREIVATRVTNPRLDDYVEWTTIAKAKAEFNHEKVINHPLRPKIIQWFEELEQAVANDPAALRSFG